ncbi:hypothetical protein E2C01_037623 [Portunus trituberculatus]|uniref:Uncharacterized protein n=1 Tax=Portunus trituberculatus TaxID=210409 RepID=A0A5B7FHI9_PORTR|nr:hypothetical protein [Portunus trituberculatus]
MVRHICSDSSGGEGQEEHIPAYLPTYPTLLNLPAHHLPTLAICLPNLTEPTYLPAYKYLPSLPVRSNHTQRPFSYPVPFPYLLPVYKSKKSCDPRGVP